MGKQQFSEIKKAKILIAISIKLTFKEARRLLTSSAIKVFIFAINKIRACYKTTWSGCRNKGSEPTRRTTTAQNKFIVKATLIKRRCYIVKLTQKLSKTFNITVTIKYYSAPQREWPCSTHILLSDKTDWWPESSSTGLRTIVRDPDCTVLKDCNGDNDSIRVLVTRKSWERHFPKCWAFRKKWRPLVHVWGLISARRTVVLRVINNNFNAAKYTNKVIPHSRYFLRIGGS